MNFVYRIFTSLVLLVLLVSFSFAQNPIPNAGFENWTAGNTDDWYTLDILGVYDAVTQSGISHSGSYAAKGDVVSFIDDVAPPFLSSNADYFPVSQNYTRLTGYYQFFNNGEDAFWAYVQLLDAQGGFVAGGESEFGQTSGGYTQFAVNLEYNPGNTQPAAQAYIWFTIVPASESQMDALSLGSYFLVDDIEFDNVSAISDEGIVSSSRRYQLAENYPNPFNPSTTIKFTIPQAERVRLSVFNSIGQEVEMLIDKDLSAGDHQVTFNANNLPSGIYFYSIEAGKFQDVKKMILLR